jgi:hypothetical protein
MTFTVERHCSERGLLQAIADNCILELSLAIPKQVRAVEADPQISFDIGHESTHCAYRRGVRQRPLNQGEGKPIEADETPFGSNPEIAIVRLADGIDRSTQKSSICSPLVVDVLGYCSGWVQGASRVHKTEARDHGQKTTT